MNIRIKNFHTTVELSTRKPGDVFTHPDNTNTFYIVIEPDYELDCDAGVYCVALKSGELYCLGETREVIPVDFEATASF